MKKAVNISNDPSANWTERQKSGLGYPVEWVDIPLPTVYPGAPSWEVVEIANHLLRRVIAIGPPIGLCSPDAGEDVDSVYAVHVMGEPTLCFALVTALHRQGYHVVASTTEHRVKVDMDGVKTSIFSFRRFRDYSLAGLL